MMKRVDNTIETTIENVVIQAVHYVVVFEIEDEDLMCGAAYVFVPDVFSDPIRPIPFNPHHKRKYLAFKNKLFLNESHKNKMHLFEDVKVEDYLRSHVLDKYEFWDKDGYFELLDCMKELRKDISLDYERYVNKQSLSLTCSDVNDISFYTRYVTRMSRYAINFDDTPTFLSGVFSTKNDGDDLLLTSVPPATRTFPSFTDDFKICLKPEPGVAYYFVNYTIQDGYTLFAVHYQYFKNKQLYHCGKVTCFEDNLTDFDGRVSIASPDECDFLWLSFFVKKDSRDDREVFHVMINLKKPLFETYLLFQRFLYLSKKPDASNIYLNASGKLTGFAFDKLKKFSNLMPDTSLTRTSETPKDLIAKPSTDRSYQNKRKRDLEKRYPKNLYQKKWESRLPKIEEKSQEQDND